MDPILQDLLYILLGFATGTYGTLVGAGGGFVLMPVLLLLSPHENPEVLTGISLAVVFFNAASGSEAYLRMGRVDLRSGLLFAMATIPGAVAGAILTRQVPRRLFDVLFGILLMAASALLFRQKPPVEGRTAAHGPGTVHRRIVDSHGVVHEYDVKVLPGLAISLGVGFLSSFLGIGGGIIHVPALVYLLGFPVHVATATSHFILAIAALAGLLTHALHSGYHEGIHRAIYLSIGVLAGAQLGAFYSDRLRGRWILLCLAGALFAVGIRVLVQGLG